MIGGMTRDLFGDTPAAAGQEAGSGTRPATSPAAGEGDLVQPPLEVGLELLEQAMCDRKSAFKSMDDSLRRMLAQAAGIVSASKRQSYDHARAGRFVDSFNWRGAKPHLAKAMALLSLHRVDLTLIPMASADERDRLRTGQDSEVDGEAGKRAKLDAAPSR